LSHELEEYSPQTTEGEHTDEKFIKRKDKASTGEREREREVLNRLPSTSVLTTASK
jgi:hypothetical protein